MSVADSFSVDDQIYRTTFDPATTHPCTAVVEAIETATGWSETPVLADSIDPDTLTQLYRADGSDSWMLSFDHAGLEVTLWGTGRLHVDAEAVESATTGQTAGPNTRV